MTARPAAAQTAFGPMVIAEGSGSELYRGVGTITLGGLVLSTALTIFVVPALFVLVWSARSKFMPVHTETGPVPTDQPAN